MAGVPQPTNFSLVRGDAASWTVAVSFPAGSPSNDLHTFDIRMTAKLSYTDPDANAVFSLTTANGKVTIDDTNPAICHCNLESADTANVQCLPPLYTTPLVYDVQITGADLRPFTVARGTITVYADATLIDA